MINEGNAKLQENNRQISELVKINSNIASLVGMQSSVLYGQARSKKYLKEYNNQKSSIS
jgi:hypothetical protein